MYQSSGKPSIAKFRSRMTRINEAAETGLDLCRRWNPKGRNAVIHRQLNQYFKDTLEISEMFLQEFRRR